MTIRVKYEFYTIIIFRKKNSADILSITKSETEKKSQKFYFYKNYRAYI